MVEQGPTSVRGNIAIAGVGNALEWYDFGTYGFFAVIIGQRFFPADDPLTSLLSAFAVFAVGYLGRPIGGLVVGNIGDRWGRRTALLLSITVMGLATFAIGLLPTFQDIGIAAPLLLVLLRLVQGFAVAAEYSSSTIYLIERTERSKRGFISSWTLSGAFAGILLGSAVGALVSAILSKAQLHDWGWRIPFLLSAAMAVVGVLLRRRMAENLEFLETPAESKYPMLQACRQEWRALLAYSSMILTSGVSFYMAVIYAVSDLTQHMHVSTARALEITSLAILSIVAVCPLAGWISDRIGRKPLALFASAGMLAAAWPLWWLIHHESFVLILLGQLGFALFNATGLAVYVVWISELLPLRVRCSVVSLGNSVAYGIFGGLTPLAATYLVSLTGDDFSPVYLVMAAAAVSLFACLRLQETAGPKLR